MRKWIWIPVVLLLAFITWVVAVRAGLFAADPVAAEARYGGPPSKFMLVDGTRLHYRDEGQGPVLVMLHGSRASLHQWDGWVRELGGRFRTIRVDGFAHGLTGRDGRDDYSAERQLLLLDTLLDRLGVQQFIIAGTSSGATEAVRYAALHPERVQKLLLSTIPLRLPTRPRTRPLDAAVFWLHDKVLDSYDTDLFWRTFLRSIYADPDRVTPELVTRYRMLNTVPGQQQRFEARLASWRRKGGPERDFALAGQIRVPVLIQWGAAGPVLPSELHCTIAAAFTGTRVQVISYPDLGHKLVLEDPARTARDALRFIDGEAVGRSCAAPASGVNTP